MSSTFNKFNAFTAGVANGLFNLASDTITVGLTNTAPTTSMAVLTDITGEISYTNLSSRNCTTTSSTQTSGTYKLILVDLVLTASGTTPSFRYVFLYDSTSATHPLIGYYDYGSSISLLVGESLTVDFDNVNGVFQLV